MNRLPHKLYRSYNKTAYGFHVGRPGGSFSDARHGKFLDKFEGTLLSIGRTRVGHDYTPLYRFLLSRVGDEWDEIYSEAVKRLDNVEPIFWMVDLFGKEIGVVRVGESSFYSRLTVRNGVLVKIDEAAKPPVKRCRCCTHTFNGTPY